MFYDEYVFWCKSKGMTPNRVARVLGLSDAAPTQWKTRKTSPKFDVQKKLADFFDITIEELNDHSLYGHKEEIEDELFAKRKLLFDLSSKATKEQLDSFINMLNVMTGDK